MVNGRTCRDCESVSTQDSPEKAGRGNFFKGLPAGSWRPASPALLQCAWQGSTGYRAASQRLSACSARAYFRERERRWLALRRRREMPRTLDFSAILPTCIERFQERKKSSTKGLTRLSRGRISPPLDAGRGSFRSSPKRVARCLTS